MNGSWHRWAADVVLLVHAGFVGFVVGGWVATCVGGFRGWRWVRHPWFRYTHLAAIGFVTVQAMLGRICPLTTLENSLRERAGLGPVYEDTFIRHWVGRLVFYEVDPWVFTAVYLVFLGLVAATFRFVPVQRDRPDAAPMPRSTAGSDTNPPMETGTSVAVHPPRFSTDRPPEPNAQETPDRR